MRFPSFTIREVMGCVLLVAVLLALGRQDGRLLVLGVYPAAVLAAIVGFRCARGVGRIAAAGVLSTLPILGLVRSLTFDLGSAERLACVYACSLVVLATVGTWRLGGKPQGFMWGYAVCGTISLGFHAFYATCCNWRHYPPIFVLALNQFYPLLHGDYSPNEEAFYKGAVLGSDEYYIIGGCLLGTFTGLVGGLLGYRLATNQVETSS